MDEDIRVDETIQKTERIAAGGAVPEVPAGAEAGVSAAAETAGGAVPGVPAGAEAGVPEASETAGGAVPGVPAGAEAGVPEASETAGGAVPGVPAGAEAGVSAAAETAVNGAVTDAPKGRGGKGRIWGYLAILAAVGLAVLGGWMFYNTQGTRLLYVDVTFGRICKYYWIAFIAMLVFFAVGLYTLKRSRKEVKKDGKLE